MLNFSHSWGDIYVSKNIYATIFVSLYFFHIPQQNMQNNNNESKNAKMKAKPQAFTAL